MKLGLSPCCLITHVLLYTLVVLCVTLFGRLSEQINEVSLYPLWSYAEMTRKGITGMAMQIFLNVFILVPLGIILSLLGKQTVSFRRTVLCVGCYLWLLNLFSSCSI